MASSVYACVFTRPPRERLVAAERLVRALPTYLAGAVAECDLFHARSSRYFAVLIRAARASFTADVLARLSFWTARAGGSGFVASDLDEAGQSRFLGELNLCELSMRSVPPMSVGEAAGRMLRAVGSPAPAPGPPVFALDLDGPGREGLHYRPEESALFVAGTLSPAAGDPLVLAVRLRGQPAPLQGWGTVTEVTARAAAAAGKPAGFTLRIEGPAALQEALAARLPAEPVSAVRFAPRFAVKAPVTVKRADAPAGGTPAPAAPAARARIEYATDQELAADWIENLSHGGAFVRTANPRPEGTAVVLDLALPDGANLSANGVVSAVTAKGMGIRFVLTQEQDELLAGVIARISARPRRALVVDDDELAVRMLADALTARGFEVITAADGAEGVRRLSEELMALDLLVTDLFMPGMNGEQFIRFIRKTGGEAELAIVAVTARVEQDTEMLLAAAGADAVLDKAIGPELLAAASDAVLERKRMGT